MYIRTVPGSEVVPDPVNLAWAAGFWDGEGCTYLDKRSARVVLSVSQAGDEAVSLLERFAESIGIKGSIYSDTVKNERYKPAFKVMVNGDEAAKAIERCWPYLSETKRAQAQVALDFRKEHLASYVHHFAKRTHCKFGHEYTPENTRIKKDSNARICLTCRREAGLAHYYKNREAENAKKLARYYADHEANKAKNLAAYYARKGSQEAT